MKRTTITKRSAQSKTPIKDRIYRPVTSNSAKPQKRMLTPGSQGMLRNRRKVESIEERSSPREVVRTQDVTKNKLNDYLKFDEANIDVKQEHSEMFIPSVSQVDTTASPHSCYVEIVDVKEAEATEDEDLVTVDFDINGVTITAKMSSNMVQLMNEDVNVRDQIIEELLADKEFNPEEHTTDQSTSSDLLPNQSCGKLGVSNLAQVNAVDNGSGKVPAKLKDKGPIYTNPTFKRRIQPADGISSMWGDGTVVDLLETYETLKEKFHMQKPPAQYFWQAVCKHMIGKGYIRVTDKECQYKFESMEATYKDEVEKGMTTETSKWKYFGKMKQLLAGNFQPTPLVPVALPQSTIVDAAQSPMYGSAGCSSEDEELISDDEFSNGLNLNDLTSPPKKQKLSTPDNPSDVELLRRTYLKVEMKKLEEMKAKRKLLRQQSRLQAERNILLSSIVDLLRKNSFQVKKR